MDRCIDCKYFKDDKYHPIGLGQCKHPSMLVQQPGLKINDSFIGVDGIYSKGYVFFGNYFGCIHWTKNETNKTNN